MSGEFGVVAYLSLVGVTVTCFCVFFARRPEDASLTIIMAALLFLPQRVSFKLPFVPHLNRDSLPYLCLLIVMLVRRRAWVRQNRLGRGVDWLVLLTMVAAVVTALTNTDSFKVGGYHVTTIPGLTLKDGLAEAADALFFVGIPFLLGRLLIRDERLATRLLVTFAVGGLVYAPLIALELRLSPQLHAWVYGYRAREGDFAQMMRGGGFRPSVFLPHALTVVMFMLNSILAAFTLLRNKRRLFGFSWRPFAFFLLALLAACKSIAVLCYALVAVPLVAFATPRTQLRVATLITVLVISYPVLRGANLFPTQTLVSVAAAESGADRAQELGFRFMNEDDLLNRARERELFGWGPYGRNMIYENYWGRAVSITDGEWILDFGVWGAVGALLRFLLLFVPIWTARRALKRIPGKNERVLLAGTATMLAFSTLDLLPNSMAENYPLVLAGALMGMTRVFTTRPTAEIEPPETWDPGHELVPVEAELG